MKALGRHVLAEMYGCRHDVLDDLDLVRDAMVAAAVEAGADVREVAFHKFAPQGVSGVVVIAESHLAIHTWPEYGYAAVDAFTCGDHVDPGDACRRVAARLGATQVTATEVRRGIFTQVPEQVPGGVD